MVAAPRAPWHCVRGPARKSGRGRPFNTIVRQHERASMEQREECELCAPESVLSENELAYVRPDNDSPSRGHVLVIPKRHVADFLEIDGCNIGVNIGRAAGQARMHVHVHLIPRYVGDVANPKGGVRCVLAGNPAA